MATLNYQNKNASSVFTNHDLAKGFSLAVGSALFVGISLRKLTSGLTKTATGSSLLFLNALVGSLASGTAGFCNTTCIRQAEVEKGIDVFTSPDMINPVGKSKICAKKAVQETA
jgi:hypothetical protein